MNLTDRQRVELAIPARLVFGLVAANCFGASPDQDPEAAAEEIEATRQRLGRLLKVACTEPLEGLMRDKYCQIARRIERITNAVAKEWDDRPALSFGMALYYFLEDLLSREVLVLHEGSAFAEAMTDLLPMMAHGFAQGRLDEAMQKQARKLRERLEREGYYRAPRQ